MKLNSCAKRTRVRRTWTIDNRDFIVCGIVRKINGLHLETTEAHELMPLRASRLSGLNFYPFLLITLLIFYFQLCSGTPLLLLLI